MRGFSIVLFSILALSLPGCAGEGREEGAEREVVVGAAGEMPLAGLTYQQQQGQRLFAHYCAICHGKSGAGDGFNAWNLDPRPRNLNDPAYQHAVSDVWLAEVITQGGRGVNKSNLMPAWKSTLNKDRIAALVAFIRTLQTH